MNAEDRLRDALRAQGTGAEPTAAKWQAVVAHASSTRRRRRAQQVIVVGLSAAAVAAVVVGVFLGGDKQQQGKIADDPPKRESDVPAYIVSVGDSQITVHSSEDGRELRELVNDPDMTEAAQPVVAPDGSHVYFTRSATRVCGGDERESTEIVRVPISGGPIQHVTWGDLPLINARGDRLTYFGSSGCGGDGRGPEIWQISLSSLAQAGRKVVDPERDGIVPYPWASSPDGSRLIVSPDNALDSTTDGGPHEWDPSDRLVTLVDDQRADVKPIAFPDEADENAAAHAFAFASESRVVGTYSVAGGRWVATFDPTDGSDAERLFAIEEMGLATPDAFGKHFLVAGERDGKLRRWSAEDGMVPIGPLSAYAIAWARGPVAPPEYFAAVTPRGTLEVRETESGEVARVLRDDVDLGYGPPRLAPSPDGRFVYMDHVELETCPGDPARMRQKIGRVDAASQLGRAVEVIATGADPALSPDGTRLAFVTGDACGVHDTLVVRTLTTGAEQRWVANASNPEWTVSMPHWSPDGRMMTVTLVEGANISTRLFDTVEPDSTLADAHRIPVGDFTAAHGYLTQEELLTFQTPEDATEIATINPVSGAPNRFLAKQSGIHKPTSLQGSSDGEHVLFVLRDPAARSEENPSSAFRYSLGALDPEPMADDIMSVAWVDRLPDQPSSATTSRGTRPDKVVAALADGPIVELDVATDAVRTIVDREAQPGGRSESVALSPDGDFVYFERAVEDLDRGCEASAFENGQILRVPRSGGEPVVVATGRWPEISPDGTRLAYVSFPRCDQSGRLVVRDLSSAVAREWTTAIPSDDGPAPLLSGPMSFAPDSIHLEVRIAREPSHEFWYVDTDAAPGEIVATGRLAADEHGDPLYVRYGADALLAIEGSGDGEVAPAVYKTTRDATRGTTVVSLDAIEPKLVYGFDVSSTGEHLLFLTGDSEYPPSALWSWSPGDDVPTKVKDGLALSAIAW